MVLGITIPISKNIMTTNKENFMHDVSKEHIVSLTGKAPRESSGDDRISFAK